MSISLTRIMLFVHDVDALSAFYRDAFGFLLTEHVEGEWVVLKSGPCEIALHRIGTDWRDLPAKPSGQPGAMTNTKLVFSVTEELTALRDALVDRGIAMDEIKLWPNGPGPLCDGRDPEGNVFQLVQVV